MGLTFAPLFSLLTTEVWFSSLLPSEDITGTFCFTSSCLGPPESCVCTYGALQSEPVFWMQERVTPFNDNVKSTKVDVVVYLGHKYDTLIISDECSFSVCNQCAENKGIST